MALVSTLPPPAIISSPSFGHPHHRASSPASASAATTRVSPRATAAVTSTSSSAAASPRSDPSDMAYSAAPTIPWTPPSPAFVDLHPTSSRGSGSGSKPTSPQQPSAMSLTSSSSKPSGSRPQPASVNSTANASSTPTLSQRRSLGHLTSGSTSSTSPYGATAGSPHRQAQQPAPAHHGSQTIAANRPSGSASASASASPSRSSMPLGPNPGSGLAGHHFPAFSSGPYPHAVHAFPHPQYPFIPSPHPHPQSSGFAGPHDPAVSAAQQQHHQQMLMHHAHLQQHQWQMEMIRNATVHHQQQQQQQQQQQKQHQQQQLHDHYQQNQQLLASSRQRTQSGPSSSNKPFNPSQTYPSSPTSSLAQFLPYDLAGAMPDFQSGIHPIGPSAYPTSPGSTEGTSGGSSGGGGSGRELHHPYRRSPSHPRTPGHSSASSGSFSSSSHPTTQGATTSASSIYTANSSAKNSSTSVVVPNALQSLPNRSTTSVSSIPRQNSSTNELGASLRPRTDSQMSSKSTASSRVPNSNASGSGGTTPTHNARESFDTARSATPVQTLHASAAHKKPSPLGRKQSEEQFRSTTSFAFLCDDEEESDDTTAAMRAPVQIKKGMGHKFKKAFGVSPSSSSLGLTEAELDGRGPKIIAMPRASQSSDDLPLSGMIASGRRTSTLASSSASVMTGYSTATSKPQTSKRGIFSGKFNSSTDNLSISSTVSSASVMIRKIGQLGKSARRSSMMSLTKAFKSNSKDKDKEGSSATSAFTDEATATISKKDLKRSSGSGTGSATTSVSHATAEHEGRGSSSPGSGGISPAAALARRQQQHYAEQEAAAAAAAAEADRLRALSLAAAHERNTSGSPYAGAGWARSKTPDPSESSTSESGKERIKPRRKWSLGFGSNSVSATSPPPQPMAEPSGRSTPTPKTPTTGVADFYNDGRTQSTATTGGAEVLSHKPLFGNSVGGKDSEHEYEPSLNHSMRREPLRPIVPRGILKGAGSYQQDEFDLTKPQFPRVRASSYDASHKSNELNNGGKATRITTMTASEKQLDGLIHPPANPESNSPRPASPRGMNAPSSPYSNPAANASAPVLDRVGRTASPLRSPVSPKRRIVFAPNLSVHTTWPASIYDRRAEPATCNRLTPTLAQQIKEELNSYKMEEMDVHPSSRLFTHFFV
ncbi:BQ2448_3017 [Microbotryum intermedium]|uniref:BQ2448_3017 protein n=1 Tax=Microbotryum intermedium TaxID=269621 RepID=A0A238FF50_9BASI|nr:BQ2448_3017 [Microbotryum intermedium]